MASNQLINMVIQTRQDFPVADSSVRHRYFQFVIDTLRGMVSGNSRGNTGSPTYAEQITVTDGTTCAYASQTVTFSAPTALNDTLTIGGIAFTAKTSGATGNQWNIGASATLDAAACAAAINANTTINKVLTATSSSGVLTLTMKIPGNVGNLITLAKSSTALTLGGAALAGGASSTPVTFSF